jgi:antitoxin component of RelBE/YafQ-DinJ toxin-antitoxin module
MKKTRILRVRVDDILYEMIQSAAEDAGITISEYIRRQLVHGKVDIHCHIVADFPKL